MGLASSADVRNNVSISLITTKDVYGNKETGKKSSKERRP